MKKTKKTSKPKEPKPDSSKDETQPEQSKLIPKIQQRLKPLLAKIGIGRLKSLEEEALDAFQVAITPEFNIQPSYALVNGIHHRVVKSTGYPRKVEDGWLQAFLFASEPYDISLHVRPSSISGTLVDLHNQIIKQTSDLVSSTTKGQPNPALEIKRTDTMRVYEALYKGEEKLFDVSLYVDNQAKELQELDLLTEKCKANLNALLIIPQTVDYRMAAGFKSMQPQAIDALESRREFLTSSLSATFPFLYPTYSENKGLFFGHERNTLNPVFVDFDAMSNKHFFVLGISGSGKSYTSKFLIMQHLLNEPSKVFILDPNGEYRGLSYKMAGQVIELSKKSDSMINLFDLAGEDYGSKMLNLISVFDIITGGLTESQKSVLNEALVEVYARKGIESHKPQTWSQTPPTFSDLKTVLLEILKKTKRRVRLGEDRSAEALLNRVRMYSKNGFFGFLDRDTQVDLGKKFIDFDLSELPTQVKQLVMFSVLELISREIKKDKEPKLVLIDEGWSLLRSKEAENYILEFIKTSRKYNASIGFITQEIEDLLRSDGGKSILNTTSTKVLLRQNSSNLDLISRNLALNEKERNYLLAAEKGQGLLITESGRYEFCVTAPKTVHKLITTNPNEKAPQTKETPSEKLKPKVKIDTSRGFYLQKDLSEDAQDELLKAGYELHQSIGLESSGSRWFFVKTQGNESEEHALMCWAIAEEIRKHGGKPHVAATVEADVSTQIKDKRVCFEVETGSLLGSRGAQYVQDKIQERQRQFDLVIILVTDRLLAGKYKALTKAEVITRTQVKQIVSDLFKP